MGTTRCEVDDVFLMHSKDGMHATLHQQGDMDIGTEPPVAYQHVGGMQFRMQFNDLGHIMGAQGSGQHAEHHAGASMKQRHQVGNGKAASGLLAPRLAKMVLQLGGIGHRKTRAIDPKSAMAQPAALVERLVL